MQPTVCLQLHWDEGDCDKALFAYFLDHTQLLNSTTVGWLVYCFQKCSRAWIAWEKLTIKFGLHWRDPGEYSLRFLLTPRWSLPALSYSSSCLQTSQQAVLPYISNESNNLFTTDCHHDSWMFLRVPLRLEFLHTLLQIKSAPLREITRYLISGLLLSPGKISVLLWLGVWTRVYFSWAVSPG